MLEPDFLPANFEEGPQILVSLTFLENPFRIFSATSFSIESGFMIIGFGDFSFPGSFCVDPYFIKTMEDFIF